MISKQDKAFSLKYRGVNLEYVRSFATFSTALEASPVPGSRSHKTIRTISKFDSVTLTEISY